MTPNSLTTIASLLADPARAEMLLAMMDGRVHPASDLAAIAHVSPSTASHHLAALVEGGLVTVTQIGRCRYHGLAGPEIAELLESIGSLSPASLRAARPLAECRSCYDHLAGRFGIRLRKGLEAREFVRLEGDRFTVSPSGFEFFTEFGIDVAALKAKRRPLARACIDWTERVPHIGGSLGAALLSRLLDRGWVTRGDIPRSLTVTPVGEECLQSFGL
ncbi:ArsR/SmtB family transcription factor [Fimbriimonas ginsengisoli]|uniref:Putative transcriptional regulator, ArsR family protein n=1 Tax=Fimbriimonas ginsengisoli Gsoil 348 TaxID=661478 RepID=A0A068NZ04_FIMGI|nr:winged helix-turn-helix domain-containing protein [Fimbriimonas ginsengisoli]AIE87729.1 putative transcriptional regulator, ArsR family protein [Fimbriimonas ginsengisoli Gsoil 348]